MKLKLPRALARNKSNVLWVIVTSAILIVAYMAGAHSRPADAEYQRQIASWKGRAEQAIAYSKVVEAKIDSITLASKQAERLAAARSEEIAYLRRNMSDLRRKNDATLRELSKILPDTCNAALELAQSYRDEADTLKIALDIADQRDTIRLKDINSLRTGIALQQQVNDSLKSLVLSVPVYKDKKFLGFIPYPSRKVVGIAGIVAGVAGTIYVKDKLR
jgi:hypothetical protein